VATLLVVRARGGQIETTRYSREALTHPSTIVIGCSLLSLALLVVMRVLASGGVAYYPYPTAIMPDLHPLAVVAVLLLLAPALSLAATNRFEERVDD